MATSKKPRHPRKKKSDRHATLRTQPWKVRELFRHLELILDELETEGTLTILASGEHAGKPAFQEDGKWYVAAPALRGFIHGMEVHELRSGRTLPLDPLRALVAKFEHGSEIDSDDTQAVRATIGPLTKESYRFTRDYAHALLQSTQTTVELERIQKESNIEGAEA